MRAGHVDPQNLLFATEHVIRVREVAGRVHDDMAELDDGYADVHPIIRFTRRRISWQPSGV